MLSYLRRYLVGGRVLKTVLAVMLAIAVAQQLGFERVTVAAIVALLTVQRSFYNSLVLSLGKLGSVLLGGILGTTFSFIVGNTPLGYGLVTLAAIYLCLRLNWQDNIVLTSITAITIIFSATDMPLKFSIEHIITALIGALCALAMNFLFTPNHRKEVLGKLAQAEAGLRLAIDFIAQEILEPGCDDHEFREETARLQIIIKDGMETAKLLREEQRFIITRETDSDRYRQAFHICNSQLSRLEEMHNLARRMPIKVPHSKPIVRLFRVVKKLQFRRIYGKQGHHREIDRLLIRMEESFSELDLPRSREEFVSRASLFHLFQEIKRYYRRLQKMPEGLLPPEMAISTNLPADRGHCAERGPGG